MKHKVTKNQPGTLAAKKELFGENKRYAIAPVHTRFDTIVWFVWDAAIIDELGFATVIRQCDTKEEALKGLVSV